MKFITFTASLLLLNCTFATSQVRAETLSDKSQKLVKVLQPFIGKFQGKHAGVKLNATFNARWNESKTAMFFTWTSEWTNGQPASQFFGIGTLDQKDKVVWHLHGTDGSKIEMKMVGHKNGKYEFVMVGSTPVGTLYEEVYWQLMDNGDFDHVITKKTIDGVAHEAFGFILKKK